MTASRNYALLTGASSGIGLALAEVMAAAGHNLILVARREEKLRAIAEELQQRHGNTVVVHAADLSENAGADELYRRIQSEGLHVDILVNNAGRGNAGLFASQDVQHMRGTLELNMTTLTILSRLLISDMLTRGQGRVLNIASVAGFMPGPGFAVYHATKAYVLSLSEALHEELKGSGVSVTVSCPGPTESEFHDQAHTHDLKNFDLVAFMTAEKVAEQAYRAMMAGNPIVVHGVLNRALAASPKWMPRRWVPRLVHRLMKLEPSA